jgi:hypothetical protein
VAVAGVPATVVAMKVRVFLKRVQGDGNFGVGGKAQVVLLNEMHHRLACKYKHDQKSDFKRKFSSLHSPAATL